MKVFRLLILLVLFIGSSSITYRKTFYKRPTQEEIVKLKELKLELTKSKVEVQIAEIKQQKNID